MRYEETNLERMEKVREGLREITYKNYKKKWF